MKSIVDNFPEMKNLLRFSGNDNLFLVWLVKRPKDGNTTSHGNNRTRTIKSYYFQSLAQLEEKKEEIVSICNTFNCRAYICLNPRSLNKILFSVQDAVMDKIKDDSGKVKMDLNGLIDHAFMKAQYDGERYWVIDVDDDEPTYLEELTEVINRARSEFETNVIATIPTVHGYHLITHRFDTRSLDHWTVDIKKDALTLLYANINQ